MIFKITDLKTHEVFNGVMFDDLEGLKNYILFTTKILNNLDEQERRAFFDSTSLFLIKNVLANRATIESYKYVIKMNYTSKKGDLRFSRCFNNLQEAVKIFNIVKRHKEKVDKSGNAHNLALINSQRYVLRFSK